MLDPRVLGAAFQARHLAVPLEQATSVAPNDLADAAARRLLEQDYDQAPVMEDGSPTGYVLTRDLKDREGSRVADLMHRMRSGNIVSADAPVGELLDWIVDPGLLFVVDGRNVVGFISVSDFNKQPVRGYLYLQLAFLESSLSELVRRCYIGRQDEILALLNNAARTQIKHRRDEDRVASLDTDLVAYLDFVHLFVVVGASDIGLTVLGELANGDPRAYTQRIGDLRNRVMHPTRRLISNKGDLIALRDIENVLRHLTTRVARTLLDLSETA